MAASDTGDDELFQAARKRARTEAAAQESLPSIEGHFADVPSAFQYLRRLCQQCRLVQERCLIPVVWRHQLGPLVSGANIDQQLDAMVRADQLRILSYGSSSQQSEVIVWLDDYLDHFGRRQSKFIDLFLSRMVRQHRDTEYSDTELRTRGFGPDAIRRLIGLGLLTNTDLNRRQLSFQGLGTAVKALYEGRQALHQIVQRAKYSQILQSELLKRGGPKQVQALGLEFHLYDLYGVAGLVQRRSANIEGDCLVQAVRQQPLSRTPANQ